MAARVQNMTEGKPLRLILAFSLPLMIGNVFQQLYTVVDTMVVGQALGVGALAALGAADWLNWMILGTIQGFTQGFSIKMSHEFGAVSYTHLDVYKRQQYNRHSSLLKVFEAFLSQQISFDSFIILKSK